MTRNLTGPIMCALYLGGMLLILGLASGCSVEDPSRPAKAPSPTREVTKTPLGDNLTIYEFRSQWGDRCVFVHGYNGRSGLSCN